MKSTIFPTVSSLLLGVFCFAQTTGGDANHAADSEWISLGGNFSRTALSQHRGPELGCVKWKFGANGAVSASVTVGTEGRVHVACEDGRLYTLEANGSLLWSYDANSPLLSAPTIGPDGTVYVGSKEGKLHAVDVNGNLVWTHDTEAAVYSSAGLSADGNIVCVGSQDGTVYALDKNGNDLWSFQTKGPGEVPNGAVFASPAIGPDGTIYIGGLYDPNLYALDPNDGQIKWSCSFESEGWPFASPVVAENGTIYQTLLYDTHIYAIEPNGGTIIWSVDLADPCSNWFDPNYADKFDPDGWSEPALGPDGTIYVSLDDPYLRAVEPDGLIRWVTRLGVIGGFTLSVSNDGLIYAACDDGHVYVVEPNGWEIARFETKGWLSFPVILDDGAVIVADSKDYSQLIADVNNAVWAITEDCETDTPLDLHRPEDLNGSGIVDFADFAFLASDWLACTDISCANPSDEIYVSGDVNRDLHVDMGDLVQVADKWLIEE
jgi:outer membrane protein assembly factor BamB